MEMEPEVDEESDPDMPELTQETTRPLSLSDEGEEEHKIFLYFAAGEPL